MNYFTKLSHENAILSLGSQWLESVDVHNRRLARFLCKLIPVQCPFERNIIIFGQKFYIPPMCKFNPLYEEVAHLRFKALCYLVDECGEDVNLYS
jgi:Mo-dependent nitrogenase C-terminus